MPEPSRLLPVDEEARAALMALRENIAQTHAVHNTWVQQDEALALKRAATGALGKLWSFPKPTRWPRRLRCAGSPRYW